MYSHVAIYKHGIYLLVCAYSHSKEQVSQQNWPNTLIQ